jgi:hypothetical protein
MRTSSTLPPGFGFDPAELGPPAARPAMHPDQLAGNADIIGVGPGGATDNRPVPTLWIGEDGEEEDTADGMADRSPGSILVTAICIGITVAALAYVMDFPLS